MAATTDATRTDRAVTHPLDPLTADEIARTVAVLRERRGLGDEARFVDIALREPEKDELARYTDGAATPREAAVVVLDRAAQTTHEAVVSLDDGAIRSWSLVPGVQAAITLDEYMECEQAVRADPRFREALARRGIDEPENVMAEAWTLGAHTEPGEEGAAADVDALLVPREPRRQRLRAADRGPVRGRRPEHDGGAPRRGHERRARARGVRRLPGGSGRPAA